MRLIEFVFHSVILFLLLSFQPLIELLSLPLRNSHHGFESLIYVVGEGKGGDIGDV